MDQLDDLKLIKKYYGENMMHLCRSLFPTILEQPGKLFEILSSKFAYSKLLYDDIVGKESDDIDDILGNEKVQQFKNFIYTQFNPKDQQYDIVDKTPQELLDEAGYVLYECKTKDDINSFIKYYDPNEQICTFGEPGELGRLKRCYVFFAVKKNVDEIKRENFKEPIRDDEYGTSVISIQFTRGKVNTLSIKNRYNHSVKNPDATFSNDLERINKGLTNAFSKQYGLNISSNQSGFELDHYVLAADGKFYKYNYEIDGVYYCTDNVVIDEFEVKKYDKEKYIIFDHYILDKTNKKIFNIKSKAKEKADEDKQEEQIGEAFIKSIGEINCIDIEVNKEKHKTLIRINNGDIIIRLNKNNQMTGYKNTVAKEIGDGFLRSSSALKTLVMPNVEKMGKYSLYSCINLKTVDLSSLKELGDNSFNYNYFLETVLMGNIEDIGNECFRECHNLELDDISKLKRIGDNCFLHCFSIDELNANSLEEIGDGCFFGCRELKKLSSSSLKKIGKTTLFDCYNLESIVTPEMVEFGKESLKGCNIQSIYVPNLKQSCLSELLNQYPQLGLEKTGGIVK